MRCMGEQTEVTIRIDAAPEDVYNLVSDLPRMGEWSPECYRCQWLGDMQVAVPGAKFKGYNRRGFRRWTTHGTIVTAEPGKQVSFDVNSVFDLPVSRWAYRITPEAEGGCTVTEVWEDRRGGLMKVLGNLASGVADRKVHNAAGMQATLERIKAEAER